MVVNVLDDHGPFGPNRFLDFRIAAEIDMQVANGRVLVDRDDPSFVVTGLRQHERAVREPERLAHAPHQCLENLVRTQRRGDFLKNVEQQIARAQRLLRLAHLGAATHM